MWIVQIALKRPYTFVVLALLIAIFGTLAAVRTPADIFTLQARDGEGRPPLREWEGFGETSARNLFNRANLAPPIGTLSSPLFGQSNAIASGFFAIGTP